MIAWSPATASYPTLANRYVDMHWCLLDIKVTEGATVASREGKEHGGSGEAKISWRA